MDRYNQFIMLLIILKVLFILLAIVHFYNRIKGKANSKEDKRVLYWKSRIEFIFTIGMALLLIYVFSPERRDKYNITEETKLLFFMFGLVLLITAKWETFIETSEWFKHLQAALR